LTTLLISLNSIPTKVTEGHLHFPEQQDIPLGILTSSNKLLQLLFDRGILNGWCHEDPDKVIANLHHYNEDNVEEPVVRNDLPSIADASVQPANALDNGEDSDFEVVSSQLPYKVKVWIYLGVSLCCTLQKTH